MSQQATMETIADCLRRRRELVHLVTGHLQVRDIDAEQLRADVDALTANRGRLRYALTALAASAEDDLPDELARIADARINGAPPADLRERLRRDDFAKNLLMVLGMRGFYLRRRAS